MNCSHVAGVGCRMQEWLVSGAVSSDELSPSIYGWRLVAALLFGTCIAVIYRVSHGREKNGQAWAFCTTLILLCGLIAMVTEVIGGSVAKAFSLVGALSIVRFRTVVEDTRDTAFVIFSVIVGMAAGSGLLWLPAIGTVAVGGTAVLLSSVSSLPGRRGIPMQLSLRMVLSADSQELAQATLAACVETYHLRSAATAKQGTIMDYVFEVKLYSLDRISSVTMQLLQLPGVQSVALREL